MIKIQITEKYWNPGARMFINEPEVNKLDFQMFIAEEYVNTVKEAINSQRFRTKWQELTPGYLAWKRYVGLSENIWEATGELKNSLRVFYNSGSIITVGFDMRRVHRGSKVKLYKLAKYLEYGTLKAPPRPLFRLVHTYMSKNIAHYYKAYQFLRGGLF